MDYIILPELNDKTLKKLKNMANIRCWRNICVSDNLREDDTFIKFAKENSLKIMDGKWLFKNMINQVMEYIINVKNEHLGNQEISILCNKLDETILEKIKELCMEVKICNILTNNLKQYQKLEEEIYKTNGIILNISNNYKRAMSKSNIIINFDFSNKYLEKCIFPKNAYMININKNIKIDKKDFNGRNIVSYEIDMPEKYLEYQENLTGFNSTILYESFIYKNTIYKNIKKELEEDGVKILYLQDFYDKIIQNQNLNLSKKLDKITI